MTVPEGLLEVGYVARPHGVRGDLFVKLTTDRAERAAVGSRLWARDRWVTVTSSHTASGKTRVHLEGVDARNDAEAMVGTKLYAEPIEDPDALWVHQLIGARVIETDGTDRGTCTAVIDNPASDLLELDTAALVPVAFVTSVDADGADGTSVVVTIDPPDGLFDLLD